MRHFLLTNILLLLAISGTATNYTLMLYADECGTANSVVCPAGQQVRATATPMTGQHFTRWSDGSTDNPRLVTVNSNMALTAEFAPDAVYTVVLLSYGCSTPQTVIAHEGDVLRITPAPMDGNRFIRWSDGNTDNPRLLTVSRDSTLTAIYEQMPEAESTQTDSVVITPSDNSVVITWPSDPSAATYTIVITKDGETVCTLIFNANGQLTGIAYAPSRSGARHAQAAVAMGSGWQFTVTGLSAGTQYNYTVTAKAADQSVIESYSGAFTTTGMATDVRTIEQQPAATKSIRDGQLIIVRDSKTYNAQGVKME